MATRIQFKNPLADYTMLTQRSPEKALEKQKRMERLIAHPIEPELLGTKPRWVRGYSVFSTWNFAWKCEQAIYNPIDLLRNGDAVPAIVTEVETKPKSTVVQVVYLSHAGQLIETSFSLPTAMLPSQQWKENSAVTVLASPESEQDVLPYCLTQSFFKVLVDRPTKISQEVSAHLHQREATISRQSSGSLGAIEPELLSTIPRKVRFSSKNLRVIQWTITLFLLLISGSAAFWKVIIANYYILAHIAIAFFLFYEYGKAFRDIAGKQYLLLKNGLATRAMIMKSSVTPRTKNWAVDEQALEYTYHYATEAGQIHTGSFFLKRKRAWHLGITEGTTFTIVYDPRCPEDSTPYFELNNAEIVGARGAKITPP